MRILHISHVVNEELRTCQHRATELASHRNVLASAKFLNLRDFQMGRGLVAAITFTQVRKRAT
jgi:hypothetical protein